MDLLVTDLEGCFAVEETGNVYEEHGFAGLRQFNLRCAILASAQVIRSRNDRTRQGSFVNRKVNFFIDLAIVFDLLNISALPQVGDTPVPSSLQIRFKKLLSPTSR